MTTATQQKILSYGSSAITRTITAALVADSGGIAGMIADIVSTDTVKYPLPFVLNIPSISDVDLETF